MVGKILNGLVVGVTITMLACGGSGGGSGSNSTPTAVTPTITAPDVAPTGGTIQASTQAQSGASYTWTVTNGQIASGQGTTLIQVAAGAVGNLVVECGVQIGASSAKNSKTIPVADPPSTPTISINQTKVTPGLAVIASVQDQSGYSFNWSSTASTYVSGQGTASYSVFAGNPGTMTFECEVTNAAGLKAKGTLSTKIWDPNMPAPNSPNVDGPTPVQSGATGLTYTTTTQQGCTYEWIVLGGTLESGQGTTTAKVTAGSPGTMTVQCVVSNDGGSESNAKLVTVQ